MHHIKNNRTLLFLVIGGIVLFIFVGVSLWSQIAEKKALEDEHASLISKMNTVEKNIAKRQAEIDAKKSASIKEATGIDPSLIKTDTTAAKSYFKPAFNWKSGGDYDKTRNDYIESLGKDNTFTATYLPPDTKIDTDDGPLSYIDFKGLQVTMGDIHIVPMSAEGNRIRYVAFVQYFMHKDESDMVNPEALEESEAIIEFTAAGDVEKGERRVTEVNARAGFQSSLEP
ncbi:hypothetical protein JUJ52_03320 [Virgibacillus sp. AGTR]|uniref:hypothetical protein n=1 Tax=Virgibacillus sp. AGTR TaxID=2812055 RepID=UPI001D16473B|nr:hypothetical protein [Virgibacillus sp. AGTR]MCC2248988.1 hypothetical protein [Virgibacillus sp. AGTR]